MIEIAVSSHFAPVYSGFCRKEEVMLYLAVAVAAFFVARLSWHISQDLLLQCAEFEKLVQLAAEDNPIRQDFPPMIRRKKLAAVCYAIGAWAAGGVVLVALISPFLL